MKPHVPKYGFRYRRCYLYLTGCADHFRVIYSSERTVRARARVYHRRTFTHTRIEYNKYRGKSAKRKENVFLKIKNKMIKKSETHARQTAGAVVRGYYVRAKYAYIITAAAVRSGARVSSQHTIKLLILILHTKRLLQ